MLLQRYNVAIAGLLFSSLFAGCGLSKSTSTGSSPVTLAQVTLTGNIHGGQQPVSGATVTLYAAGTGTTASAATVLYSTTSDAGGNFGFSSGSTPYYTCPTATTPVYVVASGGNPGLATGTNNAAISLMTALGACGNLTTSTFIQVNELTTVAAVYALKAYMTGPANVGSTAANATALLAAFNVATELVNTASGSSPGVSVPTGYSVPSTLINSLGDIIAACINSTGGTEADGTACGQLFYYTHVYGTTVPSETVTALLRLALNPTVNTVNLTGLLPATPPFQPTVTTAPPNYNVGLVPAASITPSASSLAFGATTVYTAATSQTVTLTNTGTSTLTLSGFNFVGANDRDFSYTTTCGTTLSINAACTVTVTYTPINAGASTGYLTVTSTDPATPTAVALSGTGTATAATSACSSLTGALQASCLATAFEATLSTSQIQGLVYSRTAANAEHWSNLPVAVIARDGLAFSTLSTTQLQAALALAQAALSADGYARLNAIRLADSYIANVSSMFQWGYGNYYIAFVGTPSATGIWQLQISGHHFTENVTFNNTYTSTTPFFIGVEPYTFTTNVTPSAAVTSVPYNTTNGVTYQAMEKQRAAMYSLSQSIYGTSAAVLTGTFDDVVHGIDGSTHIDSDYPAAYPTTGRGVLYSALTTTQQALIKNAIAAWTGDQNSTMSSTLYSAYTTDAALAATYVGYSGDGTLVKDNDYIRVDGPRVWIEFVVQQGVAYPSSYHFHTIWRDKTADYGGGNF